MREINEMRKNPPEGIRLQVNEDDMLDVTGIIEGPEGTPYAGGYFKVRFIFTEEFPATPPKCWFATKLFHPNVGPTGEICVNTLKKDWKSSYGIQHILVTVKCLLIYPNPESALDEEAGKMFMEDYDSYCSRAKLITSVHATPRTRPVEFDTPSNPDGDAKPSERPVASTSKLPSTVASPPASSTASATPPLPSTTSSTTKPVSRKSASPGPQQIFTLKSSLSVEKEGAKQERHPSPSPLGPADANVAVGKPAASGLGMGLAPGAAGLANANGSKAVKRAATSSAPSNAEKRKKALKRL
ncbi:ubiquitin-conjugating enzyme E2, variant 2 [Coprinopsis cinerea AmutBmut pab1-1]|nr:ubiquitin-conjugating enzyme E2, variant 2 [Coprinopsis cinerea AmutBmut pab1-1]